MRGSKTKKAAEYIFRGCTFMMHTGTGYLNLSLATPNFSINS